MTQAASSPPPPADEPRHPTLSEGEHRYQELRIKRRELLVAPITAAIFGLAGYLFVDRYDQGLKQREIEIQAQKNRSENSTEFLKLYLGLPDDAVAKRLELVEFISVLADPLSDQKLLDWAKARTALLQAEVLRLQQEKPALEQKLAEAEKAVVTAKAEAGPAPGRAVQGLSSALAKAKSHKAELAGVTRSLQTGPTSAILQDAPPARYEGTVQTLSSSPAEARSFSVFQGRFCVISKFNESYAYCSDSTLEACQAKLAAAAGAFKDGHECVERASTVYCYAWTTRDGVGPLASCNPTAASCETARHSTLSYPEAAAVTERCTAQAP